MCVTGPHKKRSMHWAVWPEFRWDWGLDIPGETDKAHGDGLQLRKKKAGVVTNVQGARCRGQEPRADTPGCTSPPPPGGEKPAFWPKSAHPFSCLVSPLFFFPDPSPSTGPRNGTSGPSLPCRWPVLWPFGASHRTIRCFFPKAPARSQAWASRVPALALTLREACSTLRPFKIQKKPGAVGFSIKNLNGLSSKWWCAHVLLKVV